MAKGKPKSFKPKKMSTTYKLVVATDKELRKLLKALLT